MDELETLKARLTYIESGPPPAKWKVVVVWLLAAAILALAIYAYQTEEDQRELWANVVGGIVAGMTILSYQLVFEGLTHRDTEAKKLRKEIAFQEHLQSLHAQES